MLSLWKLRVGSEAYYLSQVASGLDDYYSGRGEATGRWVGHASPGLDLDGEVAPDDLRAVLAGLAPGIGLTPNGERLRAYKRRVPGFDLTFSVPKSVSVVYGLGDPLVQGEVIDAGQAAVAEALSWLEREACFVRRGTNNRHAKVPAIEVWGTRRLPGAGFVAAEFRHRTSRAGDPQLHWHVLVANVTRGPDRRWSALDGTALYRSKRAAGVVFQTALRRELTLRLGLDWLPPRRDVAEVAGVPAAINRLFSKRRAEIEAELERLGVEGPAAAQQATLATRARWEPVDVEALDSQWKLDAEAAGWGPRDLDGLLANLVVADPPTPAIAATSKADEFALQVGRRLTESTASFTRHQVAQAVASLVPTGATSAEVDQLTAAVLAQPEFVPLTTGGPGHQAGWDEHLTTRTMLDTEQRLVDAISAGRAAGVGTLSPQNVRIVVADTLLGDDQRASALRLVTQGNGVEVLVGRAGTGKTYTVATVAAAYRAAGWRVVGVCPSARAARELEYNGGVVSFTVPRFHHHVERQLFDASTLVLVDEAGMCGTVDLASIVTAVRDAGGKVVLVGDHHQLPEVAAGGGFAAAVDLLGDQVCELTINRRQHQGWEIHALEQLRHGDVVTAWAGYRDHDRVVIIDDPVSLHERAVADWWQAHQAGHQALLLAGTRAETRALNRLARRYAEDAGLLSGGPLEVAGREFRVGDRVVLLHNDGGQTTPSGAAIRVDNGMLARIVGIDHARGDVEIDVRGSGRRIVLSASYLAAGWVDHGYAMTIHKSQGATCDEVFVVGPTGLYREAAYVALSRARHGARLYATARHANEIEAGHSHGIPLPGEHDEPEHELLDHLQRSEAKTLALVTNPDSPAIHSLAQQPLDRLEDRLAYVTSVERRARLAGLHDPIEAAARLERAIDARHRLAPGRRVRALDWDNVGTVVAVDDDHGTATVRWVAEDGAVARRVLPWSELKPIDHPEPILLTPEADASLAADRRTLDDVTEQWRRALAQADVEPHERRHLTAATHARTRQVARQIHADNPAWLAWWVGARPADPAGAVSWDESVSRIAAWRDRHRIDPAVPGLGSRPDDDTLAEAWRDELEAILTTRAWLTTRRPTLEPIDVPTMGPAAVRERIEELDVHLASGPPDQTRILHDLLAGQLSVDDLHAALTSVHDAQADRRDWILTNWPHVIEREQLQRLADGYGPLAHWPTPIPTAVSDTLDRLAASTPPPARREDRSLATLHELLHELDPGRNLERLTSQLTTLRHRAREVKTGLDKTDGLLTRALLEHEHDLWTTRVDQIAADVDAERDRLLRATIHGTDPGRHLKQALSLRHDTLLNDAVSERPDWVVTLLEELDTRDTLEQLPGPTLAEVIGSVAAYRDGWSINDHEPLGAEPDRGAIDRSQQWTELMTRLQPEHLIAAPALSGQQGGFTAGLSR